MTNEPPEVVGGRIRDMSDANLHRLREWIDVELARRAHPSTQNRQAPRHLALVHKSTIVTLLQEEEDPNV